MRRIGLPSNNALEWTGAHHGRTVRARSKNVIAGFIVIALFVVGGWVAARTFGTSGQEAVDRMSPDERAFLVKLQSLRRGMSFAQVVETLGRPDDEGPLQMRPRWNVGGNPLNGAAVYIHPDGAHHFTWISIGRFVYDEQLRPDNASERTGKPSGPRLAAARSLIAVSLTAEGQRPVAPTHQARLDRLFAPLAKGAAPGCAAGIIRENRWLARGGYGHASIERGVRITPDTIFYVASVSKQFTAAALLRVVELGKASLDDDVRKYLPELPEYSPQITLRHLVYQTSGLPDYLRLAAEARRDMVENPLSRGEVMEMIAKAKPIHAAGELYRYSNSNYFLMGEIVQRASGKSLRDFARETLFEPLGMKDTQYYDDPTIDVPRRAVGYFTLGHGKYGAVKPGHSLVGAGGLLTTVNDLGKWTRVFEDPNAIPASPGLGARMMERGATSDGKGTNYGAGLIHERIQDMDVVHHNGFFYGYVATFTWVPEKRIGLVALCNWSEAPDTLLQGQMLREGLR